MRKTVVGWLKTAVGPHYPELFLGSVVFHDTRQVYRYCDAEDLLIDEERLEGGNVVFHGIGGKGPNSPVVLWYDSGQFWAHTWAPYWFDRRASTGEIKKALCPYGEPVLSAGDCPVRITAGEDFLRIGGQLVGLRAYCPPPRPERDWTHPAILSGARESRSRRVVEVGSEDGSSPLRRDLLRTFFAIAPTMQRAACVDSAVLLGLKDLDSSLDPVGTQREPILAFCYHGELEDAIRDELYLDLPEHIEWPGGFVTGRPTQAIPRLRFVPTDRRLAGHRRALGILEWGTASPLPADLLPHLEAAFWLAQSLRLTIWTSARILVAGIVEGWPAWVTSAYWNPVMAVDASRYATFDALRTLAPKGRGPMFCEQAEETADEQSGAGVEQSAAPLQACRVSRVQGRFVQFDE